MEEESLLSGEEEMEEGGGAEEDTKPLLVKLAKGILKGKAHLRVIYKNCLVLNSFFYIFLGHYKDV